MPPPSVVNDGGDIDWSNIESEVKTILPDDYKQFISVYGTGAIGGFLWVLNPHSSNENLNLDKILYFHDAYFQMKELFPEEYKRPRFPEQGAFLTWAVSDNGDSLFWIVDGNDPNKWKVGIHDHDQGREELFPMGMTEFLVFLLENNLSSNILPDDFTKSKINNFETS